MPENEAATHQRDWWVAAGMAVSATSAAVSSFAGLRGLAVGAGWPSSLAPLLPLTVDAYAMTATRVWLARSTRSVRARRFARTNAIGAICLSLSGNAVFHLIATGLIVANWMVVVAVGAVPALVLGLVSHLAVLRAEADPAASDEDLSPPGAGLSPYSVRPEDSTGTVQPYRTDADLSEAAREADRQYRAAHGGRPIPRDELRRTLRIGGARATQLLRQIKAEAKPPEVSPPP